MIENEGKKWYDCLYTIFPACIKEIWWRSLFVSDLACVFILLLLRQYFHISCVFVSDLVRVCFSLSFRQYFHFLFFLFFGNIFIFCMFVSDIVRFYYFFVVSKIFSARVFILLHYLYISCFSTMKQDIFPTCLNSRHLSMSGHYDFRVQKYDPWGPPGIRVQKYDFRIQNMIPWIHRVLESKNMIFGSKIWSLGSTGY